MASASKIFKPSNQLRGCFICTVEMPTMEDPRALPCSHICCRVCLSQMRAEKPVTCPSCSTELDPSVDVNSLPLDYGPDFRCDTCYRKGEMTLATQFCKSCTIKMCDQHVEVRVLLFS